MDGNMNLELVKTVISQVGNVVGILLVAELAVWQVKKELVNKRNDEVNEKSFELCCELFELVNHNENYNEEVTDKIEKIVNERNDSKKLLHPEILRIVIKIEEYEKIRSKTELKIKETEKLKKDEKAEVTEEAKLVLKDVDYSEALYDYKSVIISKDKNLIGLVCEDYSSSRTKQTYQIYSYENGTFKKQAEIPDINGVNYENVRGMYSGNVFYLWINDNITSYDMTDGFKKIKERE